MMMSAMPKAPNSDNGRSARYSRNTVQRMRKPSCHVDSLDTEPAGRE